MHSSICDFVRFPYYSRFISLGGITTKRALLNNHRQSAATAGGGVLLSVPKLNDEDS